MNKLLKQIKLKNLIISFAFGILALLLSLFASFKSIDNALTDKIYQKKGTPDARITIVMIDNQTIESLGAYEASIYRGYFTDILNTMADKEIKPAVVGFDMIFTNNATVDDTEFAKAIARTDNVVLGVNQMNRKDAPYGLSEKLYNASKTIGYTDAIVDKDEAIRKVMLKGSDGYDSLSYTIYSKYCEAEGITPNTYKEKKSYYFKYYGRTIDETNQSEFNCVSLADLINGRIRKKDFDGKIVLFGGFASALDTGLTDDKYNSPIGEMFGVETQANVIQALLEDEIYNSMSNTTLAILNMVVVFSIVFLMLYFRFIISLILFGSSFILEILLSFIIHATGTYYPISVPLLLLATFMVLLIAWHYYSENKRKKEIMTTFKRYISPDVAETLVDKESNAFSLGGTKRNISCLFVDIRGFTKMSEELPPEIIVDILNSYLEMATEQVFKYKGMVDKFIGDCVMAIFNAPVDLEDYIYRSVCAAFGIVKEGRKICDEIAIKYNKKLEFGVGVHYGDAVVGNIGSNTRMDYTAIGDTVNTASRIEASAAGDQVLISQDVYEALKDRITVKDAGDRMFKNKKEPIKCYEVIAIEGYES